jgi:hypothetical protein
MTLSSAPIADIVINPLRPNDINNFIFISLLAQRSS